jgi:hypothetical protein
METEEVGSWAGGCARGRGAGGGDFLKPYVSFIHHDLIHACGVPRNKWMNIHPSSIIQGPSFLLHLERESHHDDDDDDDDDYSSSMQFATCLKAFLCV